MADYNNQQQKLLKKLDIPDFRHLSKDKLLELTSMIDKVDPEVAKEIIKQFPEFAATARVIVSDYKNVVVKALEDNKGNQKDIYQACHFILKALEKELEKPDLTVEDKMLYFSEMDKVLDKMATLDSDNKKWLGKVITSLGYVFLGIGSVAVMVLGNNLKIKDK